MHVKVFDEKSGDILFEGKVSTDVTPNDLLRLRSLCVSKLWNLATVERCCGTELWNMATNEELVSFKGLQNVDVLKRSSGRRKDFFGVLYRLDDGVLRTSQNVPSCECVMMTLWNMSHEECQTVFSKKNLEEMIAS